MKLKLSVMDAMTRTPVVFGPEISVENAVKLMLKSKVGSLLVQENNLLKGIVTEKDLIQKIILNGNNPKKTKISNVMNSIVVTVKPDVDVMDAVKLMTQYHVRRLPVVDKESKLVGLLTLNDVLRLQPQLFELILDKSRLFGSKKDYVDSECDNCKLYTMVKPVNGRFLCQNCERNERVINYLNWNSFNDWKRNSE